MEREVERKNREVRQVVRVVLVTTDGFLIVGRRLDTENYGAGEWCLVGGKAESDNFDHEIIREVEEETGVGWEDLTDETLPTHAFSIDNDSDGETWRNHYFIVEVDDPIVPDIEKNYNRKEFSEVKLIGPEEARELNFAFSDGVAVREFFEFVGN